MTVIKTSFLSPIIVQLFFSFFFDSVYSRVCCIDIIFSSDGNECLSFL
jgi:hypothetical protein